MAWLTTLSSAELGRGGGGGGGGSGSLAQLPDKRTWTYWCERLKPLILQRERRVLVIVTNRCGVESGKEGVGEVGGGGETSGGADRKEEDDDEDYEADDDDDEASAGAEDYDEDKEEEEQQTPNPNPKLNEARYAGTSWIGELGSGEIRIWDILGRGEERVLVVDTTSKYKWMGRVREE